MQTMRTQLAVIGGGPAGVCAAIAAAQHGVQTALAGGAGEPMQASYSYPELEALLAEHGFLIYEHLTPQEITAQYFADYNRANPEHPMSAQNGVNYCLAVRR